MFKGTFAAVPTPFCDGKVDEDALIALLRHVLNGGVDGVVVCATTGEAPTLEPAEWERVVEIAISVCQTGGSQRAGTPVLAGTGGNNTRTVVARTVRAGELGCAGALVVAPYYNKPTRAGQLEHFRMVAREGGVPILLYNIPGRTGINMEPDTVIELSHEPGIVGIKEASGSLEQVSAILAGARQGFSVLSGDDSLALPMYAVGAQGVITTTGNVAPGLMSSMYRLFSQGKVDEARRVHFRLLPLFKALFMETNPAPLKFALSEMGLCRDEVRLPLVPVGKETRRRVAEALRVVLEEG